MLSKQSTQNTNTGKHCHINHFSTVNLLKGNTHKQNITTLILSDQTLVKNSSKRSLKYQQAFRQCWCPFCFSRTVFMSQTVLKTERKGQKRFNWSRLPRYHGDTPFWIGHFGSVRTSWAFVGNLFHPRWSAVSFDSHLYPANLDRASAMQTALKVSYCQQDRKRSH